MAYVENKVNKGEELYRNVCKDGDGYDEVPGKVGQACYNGEKKKQNIERNVI